jgi:putative hemolysin
MDRLGRIPRPTDAFDCYGFHFEVIDMDGNRVDKLLVTRTAKSDRVTELPEPPLM